MTAFNKTVLGAIVALGAVAGSWHGASAAIACNGNICWHIHEAYLYPPGSHVIIHPDDWKWGPDERFVFREHEGQGYWRGGDWVEY